MPRTSGSAAALLFLTLVLPPAALAAGVVGDGNVGSCTEQALETALSGGGTVTFDCGAATTIVVGTTKTITADTTIDGGGDTTLSGAGAVKVFATSNANVTIENLTIANGKAQGTSGLEYHGGAISQSGGSLTIRNSTFQGNRATANPGGSGGAIYNSFGTLSISDSVFLDNQSANFGGALFATGNVTVTGSAFEDNKSQTSGAFHVSNGTFTVNTSTFENNEADFFGGVAYNSDLLVVTASTFAGNRGIAGGGVFYNAGTAAIANSTFSANEVDDATGAPGATFFNSATMTITSSTIDAGRAGAGAHLHNDAGGSLTLTNTIVAGAESGPNCSGTVVDGGHNIDDEDTCGFTADGSISATDPLFDPAGLQDNGGPTATIALCAGVDEPAGCTGVSPAVSAGDLEVCSNAAGSAPVAGIDQRGFVRPGANAGSCSIGAFETGASPPACGNGVEDDGETCDDGDAEWAPGESCDAECASVACADPNDSGTVTAGDALYVLRTAVNSAACDASVCDASGDGKINASDALLVLRHAVNAEVALACP